MTMKRISVIAFLLLATLVPAKAYYYFSQYQTSNGLPSNTVYCTVQDRDGFIWVGTRDGISRFDGYSFTRMGDSAQRQVMNGAAEALFVDDSGLLWFSTGFGTGYYNPHTGEVVTLDVNSVSAVSQIVQDANSNIWFCSSDLYRYNKVTGSLVKYPSGGSNSSVLFPMQTGRYGAHAPTADFFVTTLCWTDSRKNHIPV